MDYIEVKLKVINNLGTFESQVMTITQEEYDGLIELSSCFWITDTSFNLQTEKGIVVFPPEIASKSILVIERLNNNGNNNQ
jgi:hypothetical protein